MEDSRMHIVFCLDNNYIMPCGVTMISVLENNRRTPIAFHILGLELTDESKDQLLSIIQKYNNVSLAFYDLDQKNLESYNFSLLHKELSIATYARLFIANLLPKDLDKVLYLDSDMIVTSNLEKLWEIDIINYPLAGVPDVCCMFNSKIYEVFGYADTFKYINAGLLLINLEYWREHNLKNTFIQFYNENQDKLLFEDQDVINGTLAGNIYYLPIKYNVLDFYYLTTKNKVLNQYKKEVNEAMNNPVVIHFTANQKPWLGICRHPLKREFLKYKKISPWKNMPLIWNDETPRQRRRYRKRSLFMRWGLKKPDPYMLLKRRFWIGKYNLKL